MVAGKLTLSPVTLPPGLGLRVPDSACISWNFASWVSMFCPGALLRVCLAMQESHMVASKLALLRLQLEPQLVFACAFRATAFRLQQRTAFRLHTLTPVPREGVMSPEKAAHLLVRDAAPQNKGEEVVLPEAVAVRRDPPARRLPWLWGFTLLKSGEHVPGPSGVGAACNVV